MEKGNVNDPKRRNGEGKGPRRRIKIN